ncbi:MAG: hypothetical protein AAGB34_05165 [Planctomycetota bacterium]
MIRSAITIAMLAGTAATTSAQLFTTVFGSGGTIGAATPDASVLNGLDQFTTFGQQSNGTELFANSTNEGEVLFFQIGALYVGGAGPATSNPLSSQGFTNLGAPVANNRVYGVIGEGRSDIVFEPSAFVTSVTLQTRGTAEGLVTGSNPINSFGGSTTLADADATILIWTNLGVQSSFSASNLDFEETTLDIAALPGDFITRISLINEGPDNSAVLLGELTVNASGIPSPGAALPLAATGALVMARRRRSR